MEVSTWTGLCCTSDSRMPVPVPMCDCQHSHEWNDSRVHVPSLSIVNLICTKRIKLTYWNNTILCDLYRSRPCDTIRHCQVRWSTLSAEYGVQVRRVFAQSSASTSLLANTSTVSATIRTVWQALAAAQFCDLQDHSNSIASNESCR